MGGETWVRVYEGNLVGTGLRIGIVVSRFNELITRKLLDGALDALLRHGVAEDDVSVTWVPGCFEIPLLARRMASTGRFDAVVCLGAAIRGSTPHFEYVSGEVARGIARASADTGVPVVFGVITADTLEQAIERSGTKLGNKGWDAALVALEMGNLLAAMSSTSGNN